MTPLRLEHRFNCSAGELYRLVSDPVFDAGLLDEIEVDSELLSREETLGGFVARYRFRPRRKMPSFVKQTIGKTMEWVEERDWCHDDLSHRWSIFPSMGSGRAKMSGTYTIHALADGGSLRRVEGEFSVRAPLVGPSIERFVVGQTTDAFERGAAYIQAFLKADRGL